MQADQTTLAPTGAKPTVDMLDYSLESMAVATTGAKGETGVSAGDALNRGGLKVPMLSIVQGTNGRLTSMYPGGTIALGDDALAVIDPKNPGAPLVITVIPTNRVMKFREAAVRDSQGEMVQGTQRRMFTNLVDAWAAGLVCTKALADQYVMRMPKVKAYWAEKKVKANVVGNDKESKKAITVDECAFLRGFVKEPANVRTAYAVFEFGASRWAAFELREERTMLWYGRDQFDMQMAAGAPPWKSIWNLRANPHKYNNGKIGMHFIWSMQQDTTPEMLEGMKEIAVRINTAQVQDADGDADTPF